MLRKPVGSFDRDLNEFSIRPPQLGLLASPRQWAWAHLRIFEPDQPLSSTRPVPVIIFFHVRSFVHSSANSAIYNTFCRRLVAICRAAVVSVNYCRLPEHRCPAAYEDGWAALMWSRSRPWLTSGSKRRNRRRFVLTW
ncbi:Gibberellin receptor GID1B [Striga hermonthica]|uniref:Gibberellin receptor GID1B n=1 Tax=Striga hermonthica TaxID=68872 RepID=A0A9N7MN77_STRHE|nr:Gibberellin receptor GID1B [Striga hermonthica]